MSRYTIRQKLKILLWKLFPDETCPICGNNKSFAHGFENWNRRYYCIKCGLFVDKLPKRIQKLIAGETEC